MKLNLSNTFDVNKFKVYAEKLLADKKNVELKEVKDKRTLRQNSYLHICISLFGIEFGFTIDEAKTHLKRCCEFMRYEKNGEVFLKETKKMDTKELTNFIEWIRNYSADQGCYIPSSEEYMNQQFNIDKEIDKHREFL